MKGEYDNILQWPFTASIKVELLNQVLDDHHYTISEIIKFPEYCGERVVENITSEIMRGYPRYISHEQLAQNQPYIKYLMDDTLYFRVTATPGTNKEWLTQALVTGIKIQ